MIRPYFYCKPRYQKNETKKDYWTRIMRSKRAERKEKFDSEKNEINKGQNLTMIISLILKTESRYMECRMNKINFQISLAWADRELLHSISLS